MSKKNKVVKKWYEKSYKNSGFNAQRLYPNEELLRFMGRNYFNMSRSNRKKLKILEVGCGSCANLWMIAREGFDAYGLDISKEAIKLGNEMLDKWNGKAQLKNGSMLKIPWADNTFDALVDILAVYCLDESDFKIFLNEVTRILKPGGKFFSYTPGKKSDAFTNYAPAKLIDPSTLNGIYRKTSPFVGNHFTHRFVSPKEYKDLLSGVGMKVTYLETLLRSYRNISEDFEFVISESIKE